MLALKGADDYKAGKTDRVAGIEQLDDSTVRLTLTDPDATFLVDLREPEQVIVPEHILKDVKPDTLKSHAFVLKSPVGSGPYKFVQYVTDQYVEFDVNPDYFKGRPKIDKIFMKRLTPDVTVAQLESGEVDLALRLNPVEYERLSKLATLNVISRPGVGMTAMNFPVEQPRVADKRVRQGIYYAVDRKGIVAAVFQGRAKVLNGAPPALDGYQDLNAYDYNPDKGKQLLTDAGFDFSKPVRIIYDQTYPAAPQYYPIIGQQLQKLGLTVELNAMDSTAFIARSQQQRETFEIFGSHGGNQGLHPNLTAAYFDCKRQGFGTGYANCDMDALFVKARATADATQRDEIYHQIARILNEDAPQLPLWTPNDLHGAVKALGGGFSVYGDPRSSFGKVETWTLA
jgi:peptide/nickel transport system substrate-binding protein